MAKTNVTARTYPKRKRAEISYRESSSDESGVDDEYDTMDDEITTTPNKVSEDSFFWPELSNQMPSDELSLEAQT